MKFFRIIFSIFVVVFVIIFAAEEASAVNRTIFGRVINSKTNESIPGATVRMADNSRGTYTSGRRKFRLPIPEGRHKLKVYSIGYGSKLINIDLTKPFRDSLIVALDPAYLKMGTVKVTETLSANQIVERAIKRKQENIQSTKTFKGLLYSKMLLELGGSIFEKGESETSVDENVVSLNFGFDGDTDESPKRNQLFLTETFSRRYDDFEKDIHSTEIIQRRQTSNIEPDQNILAMGEFVSFYDETVDLIGTKITTPLSSKALSYYNFTLIDRQILDDRYIYIIQIEPSTDIFPTFRGTMKIVEGSFNLIEIDVKPSESTAIQFIRNLTFSQKYQEVERNIWVPAYLNITGKAEIDIIKSFLDVEADLSVTSIYSDMEVNKPLPDSVYKTDKIRSFSVASLADSTDSKFWEDNSLREISTEEKEIAARIDSLTSADSTEKIERGPFNWGITPYLDFNRVADVSAGLSPSFSLYNTELSGTAKYSWGPNEFLGNAELKHRSKLTNNIEIAFGGRIFSDFETQQNDRSYPRWLNTIVGSVMHKDYYDYYRKDGWSVFLESKILGINFKSQYEQARHFSEQINTDRSIFVENLWRVNPTIDEDTYDLMSLEIKTGSFNLIKNIIGIVKDFKFNLTYGYQNRPGKEFRSVEGSVNLELPLIKTGYNPMTLGLKFQGGIASDNTPGPLAFRVRNALFYQIKTGACYSAPVAKYGGREFFTVHTVFNMSDLWWRAIGLPLYEGRGIDLVLAASSGKFFKGDGMALEEVSKDFYSEVGVGFRRIPTFFSNVFYLGFDMRIGIGPVAKGRFGYGLTATLPF
jgi:hypothetical protein